jgi:GH15 family glucan-1,4-alpha-glucosidase
VTGEPIVLDGDQYLLLTYHEKLDPPNLTYVIEMFEKTREHWEAWSGECRLPSVWTDQVLRSAITLKLLTYESTGAMVAAATTSLPEIVGEGRNWDYRYCWLRDSSLVLEALKGVGHFEEARGFIGFLLNLLESKQSKVQILYRVDGSTDLDEKTLPHLRGYRGSTPVRIGNNACRTRQNDIFGEILNSVHLYYHHYELERMPREVWSMVKFLVSTVVRDWATRDAGIWEFRHSPRHFTHSKMLSWVALDRGVQIARRVGREATASEWAPIADTIREDILRRGWKPRIGSFTQTYGGKALDISLLQATRYGFLDPADERWIGTVRSCEQSLCRDGIVLRYTNPDDFGTPRNGFVLASFWMAKALHTIGERGKAMDMAGTALARANHLGLLSEDVDARTGELLGNFPQAYSHMAVINTANLLASEEP